MAVGLGRALRAVGWTFVAILAVLLVLYLTLLVINRNDAAPSADVERLQALLRDRPPVADADNGFVHLLGMRAAPDADPMALGVSRLRWMETFVPAPGVEAVGFPEPDFDYKSRRLPAVVALVDACKSADGACLAALEAQPAVVAHWKASEQLLLDRYRRMLGTGRWREPVANQPVSAFPPYGHATQMQRLHLLVARERAIAGDVDAVRDLLEQDLRFWREVMATSDLLISKIVAAACVRQNLGLGNFALRALPGERAAGAIPPAWRQPLTDAERSMLRAYGGELSFSTGVLAMTDLPERLAPDSTLAGRTMSRLMLPLLQKQATTNLFAARMVRLGERSQQSLPDLPGAMAASARPTQDDATVFAFYNPLGRIMYAMTDDESLSGYIPRVSDLEGMRRAALLTAMLRAQQVPSDAMAAAVSKAELRNPYDDAPFEWDEAEGTVVFNGLQSGDRRRAAFPY